MRKINYAIILLSILGFTISGYAQDRQEYGSWNAAFLTKNIGEDWNVRLEYHHRTTSFLKYHEQTVIRPSIDYRLDSIFSFAAGYSYLHNDQNINIAKPDFYEHNLWQQVALNHEIGLMNFNHRLRVEERFIDAIVERGGQELIDGSNYQTRLRYRLTASIDVLKNPNISIVAYDELFLNFNSGILPDTVDQNWIFIGPQIGIAKGLNITSGYHFILLPRSGNNLQRHICDTILSYTF